MDVYNAVNRAHREKINGLNEVQMLMKTLSNDLEVIAKVWVLKPKQNESDQDGKFLQGIFWAYKEQINTFSIAKDITIIDSTYKTNRFTFPLVVICGINKFGSTYPIAFALIAAETILFCAWVLKQLYSSMVEVTGKAQVATFMTDRELALMRAIKNNFPLSSQQLCIWHIQKNIPSNLKNIPNSQDFFSLLEKFIYEEEENNFAENQV